MAPTGSRTPVWPFIFISMLVALLLLLFAFNSQLISALKDFGFNIRQPLHPAAGVQSTHKSQNYHGLPHTTALFRERPILEDLSPSADAAWEKTLLTRKGGFLWVEYNQTVNEAWGISMFHALHCLKMLRIASRSSPMVKSLVGVRSEASDHIEQRRATIDHPDMDPAHIGHCIGYIAQVRSPFSMLAGEFAKSRCRSTLCVLQIVLSSHLGRSRMTAARS